MVPPGSSFCVMSPAIEETGDDRHLADSEFAGGQEHRFAAGPIDLRLEEEIGRESLGLGRIDVPESIAENESSDRRFAVSVADIQFRANGGLRIE